MNHSLLAIALAAGAMTAAATHASGQATAVPFDRLFSVGYTVRATPRSGGTTVGMVDRATPDTLVLLVQGPGVMHAAFARSDLLRVEVRQATHRHTGRGMLIGGLTGAAVLGYVGYNEFRCGDELHCSDIGSMGSYFAAIYGIIGGGFLGAVTGGLIGMREHTPWRRVFP